jgi:hypothetical protein
MSQPREAVPSDAYKAVACGFERFGTLGAPPIRMLDDDGGALPDQKRSPAG